MNPDPEPAPPQFINWLDQNLVSMPSSTKLQLGLQYKELGKQFFHEPDRNVKKAFEYFSIALKYLILIGPDGLESDQDKATCTSEFIILYNNLAACQFLAKNWEYVVDLCNEVLCHEPGNVKALYRRGTAYIELQEYSKAQDDLFLALQLEPHNSVVLESIGILKKQQKAYNDKFGNAMKKMFL